MTQSKLEHLQAIAAHLDWLLLDIAEKRTQGAWGCTVKENRTFIWSGRHELFTTDCEFHATQERSIYKCLGTSFDASYIVACSNNAERGWRSTKAAIKGLIATCNGFNFPDEDRPDAYRAIEDILAEWPLKSLKSKAL